MSHFPGCRDSAEADRHPHASRGGEGSHGNPRAATGPVGRFSLGKVSFSFFVSFLLAPRRTNGAGRRQVHDLALGCAPGEVARDGHCAGRGARRGRPGPSCRRGGGGRPWAPTRCSRGLRISPAARGIKAVECVGRGGRSCPHSRSAMPCSPVPPKKGNYAEGAQRLLRRGPQRLLESFKLLTLIRFPSNRCPSTPQNHCCY